MADEIRAGASLRILPWLYPAFYALHIAEEHWAGGGFPAYLARTRGVYITPARFLLLNWVAWALMVAGLAAARRMGFSRWLLMCLGTVLFINGFSHTIVATARAEYNPGLASALLLFIPIGVYTLARIKRGMRGRRVAGALMTGLLIHGVIFLLTLGRL